MRQYRPIATYDSPEDIMNLFPCDAPKPDMADNIYQQYKMGIGEPREIDEPDAEAYWEEDEVEANDDFLLTEDKKHGVRFTRGVMCHGLPYGYYIDIYELV